ncbi:uncharacterized protein BYT42DRAFT_638719 [Radiomyces spectabilis]|uniref:uncharacterized protein n=1 Tax=Radiomyces spectabilis TaxID=64574 RepID=UPI00221E7C22|nr:uncharacterized protein BYT42DRAFT_638719 [Radiomyces spectabilis]KAI8376405.1 hypothetical protein BYT42DRAFT_638719 [Radiomyces spectabilis]
MAGKQEKLGKPAVFSTPLEKPAGLTSLKIFPSNYSQFFNVAKSVGGRSMADSQPKLFRFNSFPFCGFQVIRRWETVMVSPLRKRKQQKENELNLNSFGCESAMNLPPTLFATLKDLQDLKGNIFDVGPVGSPSGEESAANKVLYNSSRRVSMGERKEKEIRRALRQRIGTGA